MSYQPKSKYKILKTSGKEYVYKGTNKFHIGSYIEFSNGKLFAGNDITKRGTQLTRFVPLPSKFERNIPTQKYNKLKPDKFYFLKNVKDLISTKTKPTKKDYTRGNFTRYFAKKNNTQSGYVEINKKTYESIFKKKNEYDHNLYQVGKLTWALEGDVVNINQNIITIKEKEFPFISELFVLLDEHKKKRKQSHNIKGRTYNDGEVIASSLPPAYKKSEVLDQYCNNCIFNKNQYCTKWEAIIRTAYWCKAWKPIEIMDPLKDKFDSIKTIDETKSYQPTQQQTYRSSTDIQTSGGGGGTTYSGGSSEGSSGGSSGGGGGGY